MRRVLPGSRPYNLLIPSKIKENSGLDQFLVCSCTLRRHPTSVKLSVKLLSSVAIAPLPPSCAPSCRRGRYHHHLVSSPGGVTLIALPCYDVYLEATYRSNVTSDQSRLSFCGGTSQTARDTRYRSQCSTFQACTIVGDGQSTFGGDSGRWPTCQQMTETRRWRSWVSR